MEEKPEKLRCSFCGKSQDEIAKLIAGPNVYICNECIDICVEILDDDEVPRKDPKSEILRYLSRARSDLDAAEVLISLSHFRVAMDVARGSAFAAIKAFLIKRGSHPDDQNFEMLLNNALIRDEKLCGLRDQNASWLITQYVFNDEADEADAKRTIEAAQQIIKFVSAETDTA